VNVDEEIGRSGIWGRLRVADYRDGGGGYCNQSGIRYDIQLRLDKTLKIYPVTGQWSLSLDKGHQYRSSSRNPSMNG